LEIVAEIAPILIPHRFGRGFQAVIMNAPAVESTVIADLQIFATGNTGRGPVHLHLFIQLSSTEMTNPHDNKIVHVKASDRQL
jgi:hypothetical protein